MVSPVLAVAGHCRTNATRAAISRNEATGDGRRAQSVQGVHRRSLTAEPGPMNLVQN